ncbi:ADP-glyceromanno-heptose 6-epimerase [bacterium]|nr:ADP-glyceromanno-heptose 6-epimerase [bacterium]
MIILTGGAGFIGSNFLRLLNDQGIDDIIVVDNLGSSNKWKNLVGKKFTDYIHKSKFLDEMHKFKNIDAIFHFGACSRTTESDIDYLIENNYHYSIELAKFAIENNAQFIYASSASTYGNGDQGYSDATFDELKPLNGYGYSKHLFDLWVKAQKLDKVLLGFKFFNVFGPNEYHKQDMSSMVTKAFYQIKETGKIMLFKSYNSQYADGNQTRDFIYVKDANKVIWNFYENNIKGLYNLGTGIARSWNDLANAVFKAMGIAPNIEYIDMPEELKLQYQYATQADLTKLRSTGIEIAFNSLEDNVNDYIENYLLNGKLYN